MTHLSIEQKQLLFDYAMGLAATEQEVEAEALINANAAAAELHSHFLSVLKPLDTYEHEECPDYLVDSTLARLRDSEKAEPDHDKLEQLIANELERQGPRRLFIRNFGDLVAIAAVLMLVAAVLVPSLGHARQKYFQYRCSNNLADIFQGFSNYVNDNDGMLPSVPREKGSPWYWVGYQGKENNSNTRPSWLLVKNGYVEGKKFTCPGKKESRQVQFDIQVTAYNDFPTRDHISYSFRICYNVRMDTKNAGSKILMSDMNPLAEKLPSDYTKSCKVEICDELLTANSSNHNRRSQNVMFCDGSVKNLRTRSINNSGDDIFSLQFMRAGQEITGTETPTCDSDTFLAP